MSKPGVDIVIASYGTPGTDDPMLSLCLDTVAQHTQDIAHEIIIERSTDAAATNRNRALERSSGDYVCFLDDDAWVTEGWCSTMVAYLEQNPHVGMVGPKLKLENGKIFACGIGYEPPLKFYPIAQNLEDGPAFDKVTMPFAIPTTCLIVRRAVLEQAGHFDEGYLSCQWEDLDFFLRLKLTGFEGHILGGVTVYHANKFRCFHYDENYRRLMERWMPYADVLETL